MVVQTSQEKKNNKTNIEKQADQQVGSSDHVLHRGGKDYQILGTGFLDSPFGGPGYVS